MNDARPVWRDNLSLLAFRMDGARMRELGRGHLGYGLLVTWVVGMGRYWDSPRAHLGQHLGVGSVVYLFVLAALLWCVAKPLAPERTRYVGIVAFLSLTAAPAILYAVPVERFMTMRAATRINVWFLAIVALWRVLLLVRYLRVALALSWWRVAITALTPLAFIVCVLAVLNLEHATFAIMAGLRDRTSADGAFTITVLLAMLAKTAAPFLLVAYAATVGVAVRDRRRAGGARA